MANSSKDMILSGFIMDETIPFTLTEIRQQYAIDEALLMEMIEYGLIPSEVIAVEEYSVDYATVRRIQSALRLQRDLEINIPGIVMILDLLEELEQVQQELAVLRKNVTSQRT